MIANTLYGSGGSATGLTMNEVTSLMPKDVKWEYSLDKAKPLLDQAGATPGGDGIRVLNGRKMSWVYQTSVNSIRQKTQEIVKASLKQLGIDIEIRSIEASVYFSGDPGNNDTTGHFFADLEMYNNGAESPFPRNWYRRYLSTAIAQKDNNWALENYSRYANPAFDALYNQVIVELDPQKYTDLFMQMQRLVVDDVAEIGLVARNNVAAANAKLTGYQPTHWASDLWDLKSWRKG